jgi:hypothetical protein
MYGIYLKSSKNFEYTMTIKAVYQTFSTKEEAITERDRIESELRDAFQRNAVPAPMSFIGLGVCEMTDGTSIIPIQ